MREAPDILTHAGEGWSQGHHTIRSLQLFGDRLNHECALFLAGGPAQDGPALRIEKDAPLCVFADTKRDAVVGDAAGIPASIPQPLVDRPIHRCRSIPELIGQTV